jgi:manganese transport system ATP-binding protein
MRKVLMHGAPEVVLQPENLAMAFGLDVLNRDGAGYPRPGLQPHGPHVDPVADIIGHEERA